MTNESILKSVETIRNEIAQKFDNPILMDVYHRSAHDIAYGGGLTDPGFAKDGTMTLYENILVNKGFLGIGKRYNRKMLCAITPRTDTTIPLPVFIISDVKDKVQEPIERNLKNYKLKITVEDRIV